MSNSMKAMRVVQGISQSLCIVLLLLACDVLSAQNQEHRVRNIVLVHGAWADPAQFHEYFAADLSAEQAAFMARSQVLCV